MKKSFFLAALLVVSAANAQEAQFKWSGGLELEYESQANYDFNDSANDRRNDFVQTTKLGLDIMKSESVMGRITLRNVALWGHTDAFTGTETAYKSENSNTNEFLVEEAYGVWKINDASALQFGRGSFELANGELVSKRGNGGYIPISFDGLLYSHELEPVRLSFFGVRAVDETFNQTEGPYAAAAGNSDAHFYGAVFDIKSIPEFLNKLNVHYVGAKSNSAKAGTIPKNERTWIGLSAGGETGAFDYSLAYENFTGEIGTVDREGDMYNLAFGFNMPEAKGLRIGASYHVSSGDDGNPANGSDAYDSFNYDQERYTGRMRIARWGNGVAGTNALIGTGLTAIGVHVKTEPSEGVKVFADYYMFSETEKRGTDDEIGSELDVAIEKTYSNGIKAGFEYGMFMPGDDHGDDDAERIALTIGYDF